MSSHKKAVLIVFSGLFGLLILLFGFILYFEARVLDPEAPMSFLDVFDDEDVFWTDGILDGSAILGDLILEKPFMSKLDGLRITGEEGSVIAVMIENHPDARLQQEGLRQASIVYETLAEGGITRFLALYSYQDLEWIGPVRSARSYFVDFAGEYGAAYVHAGGSPDGLSQIYRADVLNVEALYWEEVLPSDDLRVDYYFVRDSNYFAPHDLFGSFQGIRKIMKDKKWDRPLSESRFLFEELGEDAPLDSAERITIDFSTDSFEVEYVYDVFDDRYVRYQAGVLHNDDSGLIAPRNILVQFTTYYAIDEEGRLVMETSGTGKAFLFTGGRQFTGLWEKKSGDFTSFYDAGGEEFVLQPGQTWIEVIDGEERVSVR